MYQQQCMQAFKYFSKMIFLCVLSCFAVQKSAGQQPLAGGFQVQNKATGLLLRPMDANGEDGTPIVVYPKYAWRCLTWDLVPAKDPGTFVLKNYFTQKTFQAADGAKENAPVVEATIQTDAAQQQWQFIKVSDGYYKIAALHSDLVVTVEGNGINAKIVLKKWSNAPVQLWKLLPKPEDFTG